MNNKDLVFLVPDVHVPAHDEAAVEVCLKAHEYLRPHRTILLGDVLDAGTFSSWGASTIAEVRVHNFQSELDTAKALLARLEKNTDKIVFIEGNHEYRVERYSIRQGLAGVAIHELISPRVHLSADREKPFQWVPYVERGALSFYPITRDLIACHGWSHAKQCSTQMLALTQSRSVVFGHVHRQVSTTTRDPFSNKRRVAWSPGCLAGLQPTYLHGSPAEWTHGFGLVYIGKSGFSEYTCSISKGQTVLPDGKLIVA